MTVQQNERDIKKLKAKLRRLVRRLPQNILLPPETKVYDGVEIGKDELWFNLTYDRSKPTVNDAMAIMKAEYNIADSHDDELEAQIADYFSWMYKRTE